MKEPIIKVGLLASETIDFELNGRYEVTGSCREGTGGQCAADGVQQAIGRNNKIFWQGVEYETLCFIPCEPETQSFELKDVVIGIGFHWERRENQRFRGGLMLLPDEGKLIAINLVGVEEYLKSVISSEMSAHASPALLKAHAVISRSLVLKRLQQHTSTAKPFTEDAEGLRWYDTEQHTHFDVCAGDHCQRYQGITRAGTPWVEQAVNDTCGEVLMHGGAVCDARFSKCCGGAMEEFSACWESRHEPYLSKGLDRIDAVPLPDLRIEAEAGHWIRTAPEAFCHTTDARILKQVLNHYDQETPDFYRWQVEYTQQELAALIKQRSGTDYGDIIDLIPVARGTSGRIWKLKIVGTKQTGIIGKELEIRRTLSPTHLYSSAFVVDKESLSPAGIPGKFRLTGAGWGHGVGLCQIGAAVMGAQGYGYRDILLHYYKGAEICTCYHSSLIENE